MVFNYLTFLLSLNFILLFLVIIKFYKNKKIQTYTEREIKQSFRVFCKYLDQYYITNIYYTIFAVCLYIFLNFLIFLIFRAMLLGQMTFLLKLEFTGISFNSFFSMVSVFVIFFICILFLRYFSEKLFFKEVLKLHIYLNNKVFFVYVKNRLVKKYSKQLLEIFAILFYRIASLSYNSNRFKADFDDWFSEQINENEYDYAGLFENYYIKNIAETLMYFSKKYSLISKIFFKLAYLLLSLRNLCSSFHAEKDFYSYFIYSFLFLVFLYEIFMKEFFYIYYATFFYFLLYNFQRYRKFLEKLDFLYLHYICKYFYKNEISYEQQRVYVFTENMAKSSRTTEYISYLFHSDVKREEPILLLYVVLNNMNAHKSVFEHCEIIDKKRSLMYIRYHFVIFFMIISLFLLFKGNIYIIKIFGITLPVFIMLLPLVVMIICAKKAFKQTITGQFTLSEDGSKYEEKPVYDKIFWIGVIIQGYIFWALLLKPAIILMDTELLLKISFILKLPEEFLSIYSIDTIINYEIMTIEKIYTIEEKIQYLYDKYEYYVTVFDYMNKLPYIIDKDYVRHGLRQLSFQELLQEKTLEDIRIYVLSFLHIIISKAEIDEANLKDLIFKIEESLRVKEAFKNFSNIVVFITMSKVYMMVADAFYITINPTSLATKIFATKVMTSCIEILMKFSKK